MSETEKFFFEEEQLAESASSSEANGFFASLKESGILKEGQDIEEMEAQKVEAEASMKRMESKILLVEYGPYKEDYAVHVTPTHPTRNLGTEDQVKRAFIALCQTLNKYVPHTTQVDIFPPNDQWKMKVISAVVRDGNKTWNFNIPQLEEEGIAELFQAVEKVILS